MAPAPRKTTGTSRPRTKGAAPAVDETPEDLGPLTAEEVVAVEAPTGPEEDQEATQAVAEAKAPENETTPEAASPGRDFSVLSRLADTSGRAAVTPYPADGVAAPTPVVVPPPLRETHRWVREGDPAATARVLVDGWRVRINGINRFAAKGDRVTAPRDVIEAAVNRGSLLAELEVKE